MTTSGAPPARTWDAALVADDLTGAGDGAVRFADGGWRTLLAVGPGAATAAAPAAGPSLLALSSDVRAAPASVARAVVHQRVAALLAAGTPRLYLKVDSTLRGSVAAQVGGALDAWTAVRPDAFAVVCPAYPAMGRTVTGGRALVDGTPLEDAAAGSDPVTPVRTSELAELLPGSRHVSAPAEGAADADALAGALLAAADVGGRVLTVDARDDVELDTLARAIVACGDRVLPVGSAGLADPVARLWWPQGAEPAPRHPVAEGGGGPVLVLVTSLHPVALEQVDRLAERPGCVVVRSDEAEGTSAAGAEVVVVLAPERPADGSPCRGSAVVASSTAEVADRLHVQVGASAVVAVGGDGAAALLERWQASGIDVHGALAEGVPSGVLVGGRAAGLPLASKAGGFGEPGTLVEVVDRLRARAAAPPSTLSP